MSFSQWIYSHTDGQPCTIYISVDIAQMHLVMGCNCYIVLTQMSLLEECSEYLVLQRRCLY